MFPRADFLNAPKSDQDQLFAKKPKTEGHRARFQVNMVKTSKFTTIILTVKASSIKFRSFMHGRRENSRIPGTFGVVNS